MKLLEAQALFWRAVRAEHPPPELRVAFAAPPADGITARMQIYRNAYWARHEKRLAESYPRLHAALGPSAFRELAHDYILAHPSTTDAIELAGQGLARHMAGAAQRHDRWLVDVAALEWARVQAILAPDAPAPLHAGALGARDAPERTLRLRRDLSVVRVCLRALLWVEDTQDRSADDRTERWVAVSRGRRGTLERTLTEAAGAALRAALDGETLAATCARFAGPDAATEATEALMSWCEAGWIIGLEPSDEPT